MTYHCLTNKSVQLLPAASCISEMTTLAPCFANNSAGCLPMPDAAPVMITVYFSCFKVLTRTNLFE
jgi:hypothetical protein